MNKDHGKKAGALKIAGEFRVDFSNVSEDTTRNYAPVWLDNAAEGLAEDVTVENVIPNPSNTDQRHFGVMMSDVNFQLFRPCAGNNTGYEGLDGKGNSTLVIVEDYDGYNNLTHLMQATGFAPSSTDDQVNEVRFLNCDRDGNLTAHNRASNQTKVVYKTATPRRSSRCRTRLPF